MKLYSLIIQLEDVEYVMMLISRFGSIYSGSCLNTRIHIISQRKNNKCRFDLLRETWWQTCTIVVLLMK